MSGSYMTDKWIGMLVESLFAGTKWGRFALSTVRQLVMNREKGKSPSLS